MATAAEEFDRAFAAARRQGSGTFTHKGKEYSTKTAEESMLEEYQDKTVPETGYGVRSRDQARAYRDYVVDNASEKDLSRGANLRADAVKKLRKEGKIDDSKPRLTPNMRYKSGGKVSGDGICQRGRTRGRMV
tara:strand:- start:3247 stop:3645 length:399 start_codon:yes stop_codon:yes gene_type:complete